MATPWPFPSRSAGDGVAADGIATNEVRIATIILGQTPNNIGHAGEATAMISKLPVLSFLRFSCRRMGSNWLDQQAKSNWFQNWVLVFYVRMWLLWTNLARIQTMMIGFSILAGLGDLLYPHVHKQIYISSDKKYVFFTARKHSCSNWEKYCVKQLYIYIYR